jgi:DNA polymerase III alpha subunit
MVVGKYGEVGFTQTEVIDHLRENPEFELDKLFLVDGEQYEKAREETCLPVPEITLWDKREFSISADEYHKQLQNIWLMPKEYQDLDIKSLLLSKCTAQQEIDRINRELELYEKFSLLNLLRYLKYLRDVADQNHIVWGVGRGSSCCSFCLYLLKIHRVDSLKYDLDIKDFLRE